MSEEIFFLIWWCSFVQSFSLSINSALKSDTEILESRKILRKLSIKPRWNDFWSWIRRISESPKIVPQLKTELSLQSAIANVTVKNRVCPCWKVVQVKWKKKSKIIYSRFLQFRISRSVEKRQRRFSTKTHRYGRRIGKTATPEAVLSVGATGIWIGTT